MVCAGEFLPFIGHIDSLRCSVGASYEAFGLAGAHFRRGAHLTPRQMATRLHDRGLMTQRRRIYGSQELPGIENPGDSGWEFRYLWDMAFLGALENEHGSSGAVVLGGIIIDRQVSPPVS